MQIFPEVYMNHDMHWDQGGSHDLDPWVESGKSWGNLQENGPAGPFDGVARLIPLASILPAVFDRFGLLSVSRTAWVVPIILQARV
jgi:hypothetical protein